MGIYSLTFDLLGLFSSGTPQLNISYGDQDLGVEYAYASTTAVNLTIDTGSMGFDSTLLRFTFIESTGEVGDAIRLTNLQIDGNNLDSSGFSTDRGGYFHDGILNLSQGGYTEYDASVFITDTMLNPPSGDDTPAATVTGTAGDDNRLYGTNDVGDVINALGGNDYVVAFDGNDLVNAGTGNDYVKGQGGVDTLNGDAGDDRLYGGVGNDIVNGGADNDRVYGNEGNDVVSGDGGNDRVYGNAGDDDLYGGTGNDRLSGGDGSDDLFGEDGDDHLFGGAGNDILRGGNNNDRLRGNDGNDELHGDAGDDDLNGQDGNDTLYGGLGSDTLNGEYGADILNGDDNDDYLIGGQGADTLNGGDGNDTLYGGGVSVVDQYTIRDSSAFGLSGVFFLEETQSFYRVINGAVDIATARAGAAAATLNGVGGHIVNITSAMENSFIDGVVGNSWLGGTDEVVEEQWVWELGAEAGAYFYNQTTQTSIGSSYENWGGGEPNDYNTGEDYIQFRNGGSWNDYGPPFGSQTLSYVIEWNADDVMADNSIDTLNGGDGDDTLYGGAGNDILNGENDNDVVYGQDGNDNIDGGSGNDALYGQDGADTIDGGLGTDFISGGDGNDIITDFFGTNTLYGNAGNDSITAGSGTDYIYGGTGADTIDGNGGNDWIYLASGDFVSGESITGDGGTDTIVLTEAMTIDLSIGTINTVEAVSGSSGNDNVTVSSSQVVGFSTIDLNGGTDTLNVLASGDISGGTVATISDTEVGNLVGTTGNDSITLTGAQLNAILIGSGTIDLDSGGSDTINLTSTSSDLNTLGATNASIQGLEIISAATAGAGVTITLSGQTEDFTITGSGSGDILTGGTGDDTINGNGGNDTLNGGDGDDILEGGAGNDALNGGNNTDTASFASAGGAVTVNLLAGSATGDGTDTLSSIENIIGSSNNDTFIGNTGNNDINGGAGTDLVDYSNAAGGVNVNLSTGNVTGDGNDTLSLIENVDGSNNNDTITGDGNANVISGNDGDDTLNGGGGADTIYSSDNSAQTDVADILAANPNVSYNASTGNFYQHITTNAQWNTANTTANGTTLNGVNGHLAVVSSQEENDYLTTISGGQRLWIGGNDATTEGEWFWTAGPEAGTQFWTGGAGGGAVGGLYSNWVAGDPSNGSGAWDYIEHRADGTWWSNAQTASFDYIIEWEGDAVLGTSGTNTIDGGAGNDSLYGTDAVQDIFDFNSGGGVDTIYNFTAADTDALDISSLLTGYTPGVSDINDFIRFVNSGADTTVQVDTNGGANSFATIATIDGVNNLDADALLYNGSIIA